MPSDGVVVHEAFKTGDLETLRMAADNLSDSPNCRISAVSSHCLEYAIYHSSLSFIQALVGLGADPNYESGGGFPSIIAALSTDRGNKYEIIEFLIAAGTDVQQRGVNDYTPLHYAASQNDPVAAQLLVSHGADLTARTRIDDCTTPLQEAMSLGCSDAVKVLEIADTGD